MGFLERSRTVVSRASESVVLCTVYDSYRQVDTGFPDQGQFVHFWTYKGLECIRGHRTYGADCDRTCIESHAWRQRGHRARGSPVSGLSCNDSSPDWNAHPVLGTRGGTSLSKRRTWKPMLAYVQRNKIKMDARRIPPVLVHLLSKEQLTMERSRADDGMMKRALFKMKKFWAQISRRMRMNQVA